MSYYYNGNYNAQSSANGGHHMRGGQGNGMAAATHGRSLQHPQPLHRHSYQHPPALQQLPQAPPQQAPAPRQTLPAARAPPPPPIHFVLDRQYTLCDTAQTHSPAPAHAPHYVPVPGTVPHFSPARDGTHYTPTRNVPHLTTPRDAGGPHYAPTPSNGARYVPPALRNAAHYTAAGNAPHYTPAGNGAHYVPAPPPPAPAPALVPFRCSHPQCGGRVVMVPSAREHMWAAHRVRV